tara:strand:+ start:985 stop:2316 length:1332 start_codon:yes stop_codon:yes gene_type:complete
MSKNFILIDKKIKSFNKNIIVDGDKSLSIRWALIASQAIGTSKAKNLLRSEDVNNTLRCLKKLGIKISQNQSICSIEGRGLNGFIFKKNMTLDAGNSGTLGRLILSLLIKSPYKIKIVGDKSLSKRDFSRVIEPLKKIGANFYPNNKYKLPIYIKGTDYLRPINYFEKRGSAQCKTCVMLASLNIPGVTRITAMNSRDHTEKMFQSLRVPIKIKKKSKYDLITLSKPKFLKKFNFDIPGDISSASFFIVLTLLSENSSIILKNININTTRIGVIKILNKMGAKIKFQNIKIVNGEKCSDIKVKSINNFKSIKCPTYLNSAAIDEFLIIFLVAAKAKGVSYFKGLSELNQKESPRLKIAAKVLKLMGVRLNYDDNSIKIYGNPNLKLKKRIVIKNFLKDHRVFMMSVISALSFGGVWKIFDPNSVKTSFPSFFKKIKEIGGIIK